MGSSRNVGSVTGLEANLETAAAKIFDPKLQKLGLTAAQIENQSLRQLEESLERINEAINNPSQFGEVSLKISADAGVLLVKAKTESHVTVGILPTLLERKKLILDRIRLLKGDNINDLIDAIDDSSLKEKLKGAIQIQSESENVEKDQAIQRSEIEASVKEAIKSNRSSFDRHPVIWVLGVAATAFGIGFGAYNTILTTSGRHVLSETQYEEYIDLLESTSSGNDKSKIGTPRQ